MTPPWASPTVIHLIAGILIDADGSRLPVLADALEDAGYVSVDDSHTALTLRLLRRGCLYALGGLLRRTADECDREQYRREQAAD
jgi:hypothetical protein